MSSFLKIKKPDKTVEGFGYNKAGLPEDIFLAHQGGEDVTYVCVQASRPILIKNSYF